MALTALLGPQVPTCTVFKGNLEIASPSAPWWVANRGPGGVRLVKEVRDVAPLDRGRGRTYNALDL